MLAHRHGAVGPALFALLASSSFAQFTSFVERTTLGVDDAVITPDGRYAVARTGAASTRTFVIDLAERRLVYNRRGPQIGGSGPANDAVAATSEYAITLGSRVQVLDLTGALPAVTAVIDCGFQPRDVEIRPGVGDLAVVRGGSNSGTGMFGTFVIDLATGGVLLQHDSSPPGIDSELGNDLVAVSRDHAVSLAFDPFTDETSFIVLELDPPTGGGPRIVLETFGPDQLAGRPMDVVISPDGMHATVRSADEVALVRLDGSNSQVVRRFNAFPGATAPFFDSAMDTVVMTNDHFATITRGAPSIADGYVNVQDIAGTNWFATLDGVPRDLEITPDGRKLFVHTAFRLYQFDLTNLPIGGGPLSTTEFRVLTADATGVLAGLDSFVCTNRAAAVIWPTGGRTRVRVYDLTTGTLPTGIVSFFLDSTPIDVDISSDGAYVVASTRNQYAVVDVRTGSVRIDADSGTGGWFPWCDGVAVHPDHAAAFGIGQVNMETGWLDTIDLVSREAQICRSLPNSTGEVGDLFALGSTRVNENDLELHANSVPPGAVGLFLFGSGSQSVLLGGGRLCVSGSLIRSGVQVADASGSAVEAVDITQLPPIAGGVVPGSTWFTQFAHRDTPASGGFNFTNASSLLFE
ncbi:MAG: hypothetical protein AAF726_05950 [Planctomycetota bacterium]